MKQFNGIPLFFLKKQCRRLKVDNISSFCDNIFKWSRCIRQIESDNNPMAAAKTTSAKGVYQFTDDSVDTAKNRMYNMGFFKEEIREIPRNPQEWTDAQADSVFLANMFAQRGSDKVLHKVGLGDLNAWKEAYYKFHHTDPDDATIRRVEKLMI